MIIVVTGTPGTGKTTVSKYIADQLGYTYIDGNDFLDNACMDYDEDRDCKIIDSAQWIKNIQNHLESKNIDNAVIDSHFSQELPAEILDFCIVTTCDRTLLRQRLLERGYKKEKIDENIEAEIMEVCAIEAQEHGHKIYMLDTTHDEWKKIVMEMILKKQ